jgi:glutathione synthase/RimK-type ligase-like ATP-grasp enzyme
MGDATSCLQGRKLYRKYVNTGCLVIAWGCEEPHADVNKGIGLITNKRIARMRMFKAGVPVPEPVPLNGVDGVTPTVVRPERHRQARDLHVLPPERVRDLPHWFFEGRAYAAKFYPHDGELRMHVAHGKVLYAQNKNRRYPELRDGGWTVLERRQLADKKYEKAMRASLAAVDALGLDFGAVDILFNHATGDCVVGEVNTAPGLAGQGYGFTKYAKYFAWLSRNRGKGHWDWTAFKKNESLIWKNEQLDA